MAQKLDLRPHHLLILRQQLGKTQAELFQHFNEIKYSGKNEEVARKLEEIQKDSQNIIKLEMAPDYICRRCNYYNGKVCTKHTEEELILEDIRTLKNAFPHLEDKNKIKISELVSHKLPLPDVFYP